MGDKEPFMLYAVESRSNLRKDTGKHNPFSPILRPGIGMGNKRKKHPLV